MDVELSALNALEIAEKIERNGATFYRRAAGLSSDPDMVLLFVQLAQWETRHLRVFQEMKKRCLRQDQDDALPGHSAGDLLDARVMAGLAVFGIQKDPSRDLISCEGRPDVLRMALDKERDSIVFYSGLRAFMPQAADQKAIEDIITEEMKHVRILVQSLEQTA
jgi:rubrerythrin